MVRFVVIFTNVFSISRKDLVTSVAILICFILGAAATAPLKTIACTLILSCLYCFVHSLNLGLLYNLGPNPSLVSIVHVGVSGRCGLIVSVCSTCIAASNMELSGKLKVAAVCAIGVAGSLFIGYCIYFDRKRRSHPDYKKKVIESELVFQ